MKYLLLALLFNTIYLASAAQTAKIIRTKEENRFWVETLNQFPLEQQLKAIKERLLIDTAVYYSNHSFDRIILKDIPKNKIESEAKPLFFVNNYFVNINNTTPASAVEKFNCLLILSNINSIKIFTPNDNTTEAIYGSAAKNGVIVILISNKKIVTKIKKIRF